MVGLVPKVLTIFEARGACDDAVPVGGGAVDTRGRGRRGSIDITGGGGGGGGGPKVRGEG